MITPAWCRAMAAYNAEMNRRLFAAADTLEEAQRHQEMGAFFGSIHGTLCHILWGDRMWMSRFDHWVQPSQRIGESRHLIEGWEELKAARAVDDARLEAWAQRVTPAALEGELAWFSGATQTRLTKPRWLCVAHMFNHQTHHRGQAHALLTRLGCQTGVTDLPWVIADGAWYTGGTE